MVQKWLFWLAAVLCVVLPLVAAGATSPQGSNSPVTAYSFVVLGPGPLETNWRPIMSLNASGAVLWQGPLKVGPVDDYYWIPSTDPKLARAIIIEGVDNALAMNDSGQVTCLVNGIPSIWQPPAAGQLKGHAIPVDWDDHGVHKNAAFNSITNEGLVVGVSETNTLVYGRVDSAGKTTKPFKAMPADQVVGQMPNWPYAFGSDTVFCVGSTSQMLNVKSLKPDEGAAFKQTSHQGPPGMVNSTFELTRVCIDGSVLGNCGLSSVVSSPLGTEMSKRKYTALNDLPGGDGSTKVLGGNSKGAFVGWSFTHRGPGQTEGKLAVRWDSPGQVVDLNTLIPPEVQKKYVLREACDVNTAGEVVGLAEALDPQGRLVVPRKPVVYKLTPRVRPAHD